MTTDLKAFDPDHIIILDTLNNLGYLYKKIDQLIKTKHIYKQTMTEHKKTVGPENISILDIANNLGTLYQTLGKHRKAQRLYKQAFEDYKKLLRSHHSRALGELNLA